MDPVPPKRHPVPLNESRRDLAFNVCILYRPLSILKYFFLTGHELRRMTGGEQRQQLGVNKQQSVQHPALPPKLHRRHCVLQQLNAFVVQLLIDMKTLDCSDCKSDGNSI